MFLRYKNYLVVANLCTKYDKLRVVRFFWHVVDENPFIFDLCILFAEASGFLRASENRNFHHIQISLPLRANAKKCNKHYFFIVKRCGAT